VIESLPVRQRAGTPTLRLASETPAEVPGVELWQFLAPEEPIEEVPEAAVEEPVAIPTVKEELAVEEPSPVEEIPEVETAPWAEPVETAGFEVESVEEPAVDQPAPVAEETVAEVAPPAEIEPPTEVLPPPSVEVEPPTAVTPPTTEVTPSTEVTPPAAGAEVAAPDDVDGPGWAFTTRRFAADGPEDAGHEEARRLARLLVTEIKLYNEEQVEEGRRSRNIYRTLKEDIDRSRQIYEERVEEAVRMETDYFQEELVKILAAGDAEVLGT
jgi:hypothetical protein